EVPPNSYLLDLDAIQENARLIKQAADRAGLSVYPMTKQVGRNPEFARMPPCVRSQLSIRARCLVEAVGRFHKHLL
ncbi:MAG TPA: hypothetical protein VM537_12805, partial [Anaerolineae bacterium]|nr:hypothetical protein [Anaerolineae bacterium]